MKENRNVIILLVGSGKMGGTLLKGWRAHMLTESQLWIVEPDAAVRERLKTTQIVASVADLPAGLQPKVVVLAIKPQDVETILGYRCFVSEKTVFLSIIAGKPIANFEYYLGNAVAVVRAMPNMLAAVQRGVTVACANINVSEASRILCNDLLEAVGSVIWVEEEKLLDPVTAVSGSGPAYVFLLVEALARAGHYAGLPVGLAERLARLTIAGSGELLYRSLEPAAALRQNITSPGGVTAAALEVLMDIQNGLESILTRAVVAATARSRELGAQ